MEITELAVWLITTVTMDSQDMELNLELDSLHKTGVDKYQSVDVRISYSN